MSTPVDLNIVMPYGVTVEGKDAVKTRIVTDSTYASEYDNLRLPVGPCRVSASWEGPETVHLYVYSPGRGTFRKGTIPAGGGALHHGSYRSHGKRVGLSPRRYYASCRHSRHTGGLPTQLRVATTIKAVV